MSLVATPKITLDKTSNNNIGEACNVTSSDNLKADCFESMHAFKKIRTSTSGLRKSPNKWTKEENQKLASLVAHYGEKKWKRISAEMGGQKTGAQCAQHWKRVLSPEIRKGHWDEHEEDLLLRLVVQYGSCWKKIAKKIPQRTDIQCRYQYLKAKQSREVKWDAKEDESLIKKVMELANCNSFKFSNTNTLHNTSNFYDPSNSNFSSSPSNLRTPSPDSSSPSPSPSPTNINKENESDNRLGRLNSSCNSDLSDDRSSSGESGDCSWNDKNDVSMSDSPGDLRASSSSLMEPDGANPVVAPGGLAMHKVVWLEVAEHMARMKLTSTLRTALECKTRFSELLGNISFSASPNQDSKPFDLKGSGGLTGSEGRTRSPTDTNINININNNSDHNNNHISITNFSRNITINITNNHNNNSPTGTGFPFTRASPIKTEAGANMDTSKTAPNTSTSTINNNMPSAPSFPSFQFPPVALPLAATARPPRSSISIHASMNSGLDSLAAVAAILPREMLADYQF